MGPLAEAWRPYRAVAARLLWSYYRVVKSREGLGVETTPANPAAPGKAAKKRATNGRKSKA